MLCKECNSDLGETYIPSKNIKSVICWKCVAKSVAPPEQAKIVKKLSVEEKELKKADRAQKKLEKMNSAKKGKLRGWHKKKLFEHDGQFYSFGNPIPDEEVLRIKKEILNEEDHTNV